MEQQRPLLVIAPRFSPHAAAACSGWYRPVYQRNNCIGTRLAGHVAPVFRPRKLRTNNSSVANGCFPLPPLVPASLLRSADVHGLENSAMINPGITEHLQLKHRNDHENTTSGLASSSAQKETSNQNQLHNE
jgi:hypothetical protein